MMPTFGLLCVAEEADAAEIWCVPAHVRLPIGDPDFASFFPLRTQNSELDSPSGPRWGVARHGCLDTFKLTRLSSGYSIKLMQAKLSKSESESATWQLAEATASGTLRVWHVVAHASAKS